MLLSWCRWTMIKWRESDSQVNDWSENTLQFVVVFDCECRLMSTFRVPYHFRSVARLILLQGATLAHLPLSNSLLSNEIWLFNTYTPMLATTKVSHQQYAPISTNLIYLNPILRCHQHISCQHHNYHHQQLACFFPSNVRSAQLAANSTSQPTARSV